MINRNLIIGAALAFATPFAALAQSTDAVKKNESGRIEIGYLECTLLDKSGGIIKTSESFTCIFDPADADMAEGIYLANVTKWGIDISSIQQEKIRWAVLSTANKYEVGVLEGQYGGLSADVAAGYGFGVNAMIGGSDKSIALQPLSVTTQQGVGIAAGVETLELSFVGDKLK